MTFRGPVKLRNLEIDDGYEIKYSKLSRTGYIPLCKETGFRKKQNQDSVTIIENFLDISSNYFFGVFDGHGMNGAKVSGLVKDLIPNNIKKCSAVVSEVANSDKGLGFKTMGSWNKTPQLRTASLEYLENYKLNNRAIEEAITLTQNTLKKQAFDIKFSGTTANM